jgi:hypothetical protein
MASNSRSKSLSNSDRTSVDSQDSVDKATGSDGRQMLAYSLDF